MRTLINIVALALGWLVVEFAVYQAGLHDQVSQLVLVVYVLTVAALIVRDLRLVDADVELIEAVTCSLVSLVEVD